MASKDQTSPIAQRGTPDATTQPLAGAHIAITRPPAQAGLLASRLAALGARVTALAAIAIAPLEDTTALDAALGQLASYDWVIFTSVNGVQAVETRMHALGLGWEQRGNARLAAIGPATATALARVGAPADAIPDEYIAEAIAETLGAVAGQRILLLRADIARRTLAEMLAERGAAVDEVAAYRTVQQTVAPERVREVFAGEPPDALTFTSASTVRGLITSLAGAGLPVPETLHGTLLAAIGPITAATLREYGLEPSVVAAEYTIPGLVAALVAAFTQRQAPTGR